MVFEAAIKQIKSGNKPNHIITKQYRYTTFEKEMTFKEVLELEQQEKERKPCDPYRILSIQYNPVSGICEIKDQTLIE